MARGKKELNHAIRASVVLEKERWNQIRLLAVKMSIEQDKQITPTELLRKAINYYFSQHEQLDLFEEKEVIDKTACF